MMMENNGAKPDNTWPLPKFCFEVDLGADMNSIAFQEVSGLEAKAQEVEYRAGGSPSSSAIKMPELKKFGNVTLKKGIFINDSTFWNWFNQIKMNTINRRTIVIKLLDEGGHITMQWSLQNAWPTKITDTDSKSDGNEVAIETIEIAHEGLTIAAG